MNLKECNEQIRSINHKNKVDIPELKIGQMYMIPNEDSMSEKHKNRQFIILNVNKQDGTKGWIDHYACHASKYLTIDIDTLYHFITKGRWIEAELADIQSETEINKKTSSNELLMKTRTFLNKEFRTYYGL